MIQVFKPAVDRAFECEKPVSRNRSPKNAEINQKIKCSAPIHATELVDCENNQATGAKPISKMVISISSPATSPQISANRACDPLRHVNTYRLGRQISAEINKPPAIFTGAAQS